MQTLDRKLLRDLWRVKGQAVAIALVIALGVMMLVMMDGLVNSLSETKRTYYERYRLAQIFAPVKRAPEHLLTQLSTLPGVLAVEGRINAGALIDLPTIDVPIRAQVVSLPEFRQPRLNDVHLVAGRQINPAHPDEILLLDGFAKAHNIQQGDALATTMNGARRRFTVVGLAQAPEFLYTTPPGELMPDDARFAVMWMNQDTLAAAFDLDGAFNEALFAIAQSTRTEEVIHHIDRLLKPYGGVGAYGLRDHISNRFINEEINGLQASRRGVPPVFLGVAAFLLYIVISRMVRSEREQIGLLKAFGRTDFEVSVHYFKFVFAIATCGALIGCAMGIAAGKGLAGVYQIYYKFPFLVFRVDPATFITGVSISLVTASAGSALVLRQVFALMPAEAMRPPTPPDFSRSWNFTAHLTRRLDQPSRMVLRNLQRQPARSILATVGIAMGMALSVSMLSVMSAFNNTLDTTFNVVDRSHVTVTFIEPLGEQTLFALKRLRGVQYLEPFRAVSAVFSNGRWQYRGGITALQNEPELFRALDEKQHSLYLREDGIILSRSLADQLHINAGDTVTADVREGRQPKLRIPVVAVADTLMGAPAYMSLTALNRFLKEPNRASGAYLRIDPAQAKTLYKQLKAMPVIAGVSINSESRASFKKMMDSGAGATRFIMALIAAIITFGIIYNSARIAFAERARDLASLRVIGLTQGEVSFVLLGELGFITLLALPLGSVLGYYLSTVVAAGFSTDLYRVPTEFVPYVYGIATIAVVAAALISGALVKRDIHRLDLVSALKIRE